MASLIIGIYIFGIFLNLAILIKYGEKLGFGGYDPPHPRHYDDYDSNAQAWVIFSLGWFLFIPVNLMLFGFNAFVSLVKKIINKNEITIK